MFTIKVIRQDGYTAFGAEIYGVFYNEDGSITFRIIPNAAKQSEGYPVTVQASEGYRNIVFVENSAGKTVDTFRFPDLAEQQPVQAENEVVSEEELLKRIREE